MRLKSILSIGCLGVLLATPAFGVPGVFFVNMECDSECDESGNWAVTITNLDTFDLTKVTFDLTTADSPTTITLDDIINQTNPPGGTANVFGDESSVFGFDFTGFNNNESFSFLWDSDGNSGGLSGPAGTKVTLDTPGGSVFGFLIFDDEDEALGVTIQSPVAVVPEPATLALLSLGLAGLGFSRRRKQ